MNKQAGVTMQQVISETTIPRVRYAVYECPYCWRTYFPGTPFPVGENAKICKGHYNWQLEVLRAFYATKEGR